MAYNNMAISFVRTWLYIMLVAGDLADEFGYYSLYRLSFGVFM